MTKKPETQWDDAVELAGLANRSISLDIFNYKSVTRLFIDIDNIARIHRLPNRNDASHDAWDMPESYGELAGIAYGLDLAAAGILMNPRSTDSAEKTRAVNNALQEKLHDAVGALIGRDVYVEGMNPYESKDIYAKD